MKFNLSSNPKFSYRARWEFSESPTLETTLSDLHSNQNNFLGELLNKIDYLSLLEVGSGCGSRLIRLAQEHPERKYSGIDLSHLAVLAGKSFAAHLSLDNLSISQGDLNFIEFEETDVVLSWATLMYVHPIKISSVVKKILSSAAKVIILIEPKSESTPAVSNLRAVFSGTGFSHNFEKLISKLDKNLNFHKEAALEVPREIWKPGMGPGYVYIFTRKIG